MRPGRASPRWLREVLRISEAPSRFRIPVFLCPAAPYAGSSPAHLPHNPPRRCLSVEVPHDVSASQHHPPRTRAPQNSSPRKLPLQCTGCGAFSQTTDPEIAGFFGPRRRAVKDYLHPPRPKEKTPQQQQEDEVARTFLGTVSEEELRELGLDEGLVEDEPDAPDAGRKFPLCDRCHVLIHHHKGTPIYHPTVESLRATIAESPRKNNHIYHLIDAADFPMSIIHGLHRNLGDIYLRTKNRRTRSGRFYRDTKIEMSFVVTRSDLLAPRKEQVDRLLPRLREILRKALGRFGKTIRLGNVHCVSAKRSWWTKELLDEIWENGGAAWMVGKANVGKSQLFEAVFPKGRAEPRTPAKGIAVSVFPREQHASAVAEPFTAISGGPVVENEMGAKEAEAEAKEVEEEEEEEEAEEDEELDEDSLLPPLQPVTNYPPMPTVSALPGTTASPIRIPFGKNKGELVDLPGLARSDLELFVQERHRGSLVMKSRVVPEQQSIKPGQSLVLGGGLIRITPQTPGSVFLAYAFTPIDPHVTSTEKAVGLQGQTRGSGVETIATPEAAECTKLAGTFELCHDVTKARSGPITRSDFLAKRTNELPWRVFAIDILVEGVGWVEIVAQVRARDLYAGPWGRPGDCEDGRDENGRDERDAPDAAAANGKDAFARLMSVAEPDRSRSRQRAAWAAGPEQAGGAPPRPNYPVVEVYSPKGQFVGSRPPINGWLLNKPPVLAKHKKSRPRRSMKGQKKFRKQRVRTALAAVRAAAGAGVP